MKRPWVTLRDEPQFDPLTYSETEAEKGARLCAESVSYPDLLTIRAAMDEKPNKEEFLAWMKQATFDERTAIVDTNDGNTLAGLDKPHLIFNMMGLTHVRHLNTLLNKSNETLADDGYLWCHSRTARLKRIVILSKYPRLIGKWIYFHHYVWHRVISQLKLTRWFYMFITNGRNRSYSRVEILGRMYRAGFEVVDERFVHGEFYVLGRKVKAPIWNDDPTNGLLVKLNRVGYKGKMIGVYKFRTMYPYSEYLQPYMYARLGLASGGKFAHDYRVNWLGHKLRGGWMDEFPMLINLFKGQIKLVGVRPISRHYLSLYTPEMQKLHVSVKPGLMPPFYYERQIPVTLEDVQESERRYIEAWEKHHFATDWRYFWGIIANIVFKRRRSK